jgi:hypothetical protein
MEHKAARLTGKQATPKALTADDTATAPHSDVVIAELVARTVIAVPGVAALGSERVGAAATHGPGRKVRGVVVRHDAATGLELDVHIVLAGAELGNNAMGESADRTGIDAPLQSVLPALAESMRERIARALKDDGLRAPAAVDIYFDDLV